MPPLDKHQSSATTKLLYIGDSGAGKTGSLVSLAAAGYNLRILDLDNGLDILRNVLSDPKYKDAIKNVSYQTITDPMKNVGGKLIPSRASAWQRVAQQLNNWKTEDEELGPISSWTSKEILVIDSFSRLCTAAMNFVLAMNARLGQKPYQSDYFDAQQLVESLLQMLYDEGIKCNIIVIAHITFLGEENGPSKGYPAAVGRALPPKVGQYFNSIIQAKSAGSGANLRRKIITSTSHQVELKNSSPLKVKAEYDLVTGLAEYFQDVRS